MREDVVVPYGIDQPTIVTAESVALKLRQVSTNKGSRFDYLHNAMQSRKKLLIKSIKILGTSI